MSSRIRCVQTVIESDGLLENLQTGFGALGVSRRCLKNEPPDLLDRTEGNRCHIESVLHERMNQSLMSSASNSTGFICKSTRLCVLFQLYGRCKSSGEAGFDLV